jgi:redox-sensitive bicupin YhaK (pirin superfamily)
MAFDPENAADPFRRGFRTLESFNEETPLSAMSLHPHTQDDIEIVTYVREGALVDQDRSGKLGLLDAGEFQRTSACQEIRHRVINGSFMNPAKVFQSCITPDGGGLKPGVEQKRFPVADREGVLLLIASPDGRNGSLRIQQDVQIYSSVLLVGQHPIHALGEGRAAWLHVIKGRVLLREHCLGTGDAAGLEDEAAVSFTAQIPSEVLLFDLA